MSSSNNSIPITVSVSGAGTAGTQQQQTVTRGATVLSQAQAQQLLQRLRNSGGAQQLQQLQQQNPQQPIKIQAHVQTNPQTGLRQIIAIPIQTGNGSGGGLVHVGGVASSSSSTQGGGLVLGSKVSVSPMKKTTTLNTSGLGPNVKVVKLAGATVSSASNSGTTTLHLTSTTTTMSSAQVLTPSKQHPSASSLNYLVDSSSSGAGGVATSINHPDHLLVGDSQQGGVGGASRKRSDIDFDAFSDAKRRKTEKGGKGLRHFSMKVCEKVQAKGLTSYNEVADELVSELTDPRCTSPTDQQYDQKNIRRRVYDALNVLMAMNIISKEKKEIRWLGLPTNSVQEANNLEDDKSQRMARIKVKTQQLQDLILQQIAFKNLVERNKEREKSDGPPTMNSAIQLPFIIVNTSKKTVIDCSISNDKMEYLFNFDDTFEIHDDMEVLKRMGLGFGLERGEVSAEDLVKARQMVPRALEQYVTQLAEKGPCATNGMPRVSSPRILSLPQSGGEGGAAIGTTGGNNVVLGGGCSTNIGSDGGVLIKKQSDGEEESESDVDVN